MKSIITLLIMGLGMGSVLLAQAPSWNIQADQTKVDFVIKNAGLNVDGNFSEVKAEIRFAPDQLSTSKISAFIQVKSVSTGIGMRDKSLKDTDYFDAEKFPQMTFVSTSIRKAKSGYIASGKLTIKGVSKNVEIPFQFDNEVFSGKLTLDRLDYGVGSSSWIMGDEVKISLRVPVRPL
ncbi:MAG: YceI family protein [Bacteroidota bacterium]